MVRLSVVYSYHEIVHSSYKEGGRAINLDIEGVMDILLNEKSSFIKIHRA